MLDFTKLPDLENELGPIAEKEQVCPGVYFLSVKDDDELLSREYYAVMEESLIPLKAKSYGRKLSGLWLFSLTDGGEEHKIIEYEVAKYRTQNHLPLDEPLRVTAFFAAQSFPDYFGVFPVPLQTPRGCTTRHWILDNGIYWIETDQCEEVLAVCYPVWSSELSNVAEKLGEQTEYDKTHNIENTLGYIFFPEQISCIPLYEMMRERPEWAGLVIDKPALMNALWDAAPEYVCLINQQEQSGRNDLFSALLMDLGIEVKPNISLDSVITISPDAGKDFLLLKKDITISQSRAD